MPVRKHHTIEEMNQEQRWLPTGDSSILKKIRYIWRLSEILLRPVGTCVPRGVRKYRSIEEANADRDCWEEERVHRIRLERKRYS